MIKSTQTIELTKEEAEAYLVAVKLDAEIEYNSTHISNEAISICAEILKARDLTGTPEMVTVEFVWLGANIHRLHYSCAYAMEWSALWVSTNNKPAEAGLFNIAVCY